MPIARPAGGSWLLLLIAAGPARADLAPPAKPTAPATGDRHEPVILAANLTYQAEWHVEMLACFDPKAGRVTDDPEVCRALVKAGTRFDSARVTAEVISEERLPGRPRELRVRA